MNIEELYDLKTGVDMDSIKCKQIDLLLQSITDWPNSIATVEGFFEEIKQFFNTDVLTYETIKSKVKKLDPASFSWELESLSSLLELEETDKKATLEDLIRDILNTNPL